LFLNYRVLFERLGITVEPVTLPIAYIEAVLNYAQMAKVEKRAAFAERPRFQVAG
jgi:hypothetical protein